MSGKPTVGAIPRIGANGNGHDDPLGAEHSALVSSVSRGVAKLEAAERSFNITAKTLVEEMKSLKGEVSEVKGIALRIESDVRALTGRIGTYPLGDDAIKAMERESVREASPEAIAERDARLQAARFGTGMIGKMERADRRSEQKDVEFDARFVDFEARFAALAKTSIKEAASETAVELNSSNKKQLLIGGVSLVTIIGVIQTVLELIGK